MDWFKMDVHWRDDPKIMLYESRHGKAALVDVVELFGLLHELYGCVDMNDAGHALLASKRIGKRGKALEKFFDDVAECGIVNEAAWRELRRVGSERSMRDADARKRRRDAAVTASEAASRKRKKDADGAP